MGVPDAGGDVGPVAGAGDAVGEPGAGVVGEGVVPVGAVHDRLAGALAGDGVGEDDEADEGGDDDEHGPQVEVHEDDVAVAGAGEACEGDDHDGDADDDDGPLEELEAVGVVGAAAQPYSAAEDGDGEEEGQEVEETD